MVYRLLLCLVMVVSAVSANAAEPNRKGAYIGIGAGASVYEDDGAFGYFDDEDRSLNVFAGYKFLPWFAVEVRRNDFGSFALFGDDLDVTATAIHAVGIIPFGNSGWEMFGHLGYGTIDQQITGSRSFDESVVGGGIGGRFHVTRNIALSISTDVYVWEDESFSGTYDTSVGATQFSVSVTF